MSVDRFNWAKIIPQNFKFNNKNVFKKKRKKFDFNMKNKNEMEEFIQEKKEREEKNN